MTSSVELVTMVDGETVQRTGSPSESADPERGTIPPAEGEEEEETPMLSVPVTVGLLVVVTVVCLATDRFNV